MADVKNEAVKTIAEEIVAAINSVVEKNNKSYVNTQVANHSGSSSSGGGGGGADSNAVHYTLDNKTDPEKVIARTNIGALGNTDNINTINGAFSGRLEVGGTGELVVAGNTEVQDIQVKGIADITNLKALNGEISHEIIHYGNTRDLIFTEAAGNKLTIDRLIVLYAQIANAVIGNFVFEADDDGTGKYYKLVITKNSEGEYTLTPEEYGTGDPETETETAITSAEIANGYTDTSRVDGQKQIIDSMMSNNELSGETVSIVNKMFGTVTAATMNVARLVAVKGFIGKLYTGIIESPLMVVGDDTVYDMGNAHEGINAPTNPADNDLWIDTSASPRLLKQYDHTKTPPWVVKGELSNVNSAINLSDRRIKLVVDTEETTPTSLVLTDKAMTAIGNRIDFIASEIVSTVNNDISGTTITQLGSSIQTVARNDSQISTAIQEAGKIEWILANDAEITDIKFTPNMISAMSDNIDISAAKMQLHIDEVDLSGNTTTVECFTDVDITESPAEPTNPSKNDLWRDTSLTTKPLKIYNGSSWTVVDESSLIGILSRTQVKISADGIENTVKANSNLSTSLQNADKMQWLITNGSSSTSITLTQSMINAVSSQINITAEKINAVADQIDLNSNNSLNIIVGNARAEASSWSVTITSTDSDCVLNAGESTILSARISYGSSDVTDSISASLFNWKRSSGNATADAIWNSNHTGTKSVTISAGEANYNAVYYCNVNYETTTAVLGTGTLGNMILGRGA